NPVTSAGFTGAPVVASYLPIVPLPSFTTNRSDPDTAMPRGKGNPVTSVAFAAIPVVASYSPIVPPPEPLFTTNRLEPDTAMPGDIILDNAISTGFTTAPVVALYSLISPLTWFRTNRSEPDTATPAVPTNC